VRPPIFVRRLTDAERAQVRAGLRAADAFTLRRCQVVSASARGERAPEIARRLGCDDQTVRNTIHAFNTAGVTSLRRRTPQPRTVRAAFDTPRTEQLRALLHRRPRDFDKPTGVWTLDLAAEVSFEQGLTPERVSGETIRATLARLGLQWKRAKRWLTSPDPAYARKKGRATA
jgi:transposase